MNGHQINARNHTLISSRGLSQWSGMIIEDLGGSSLHCDSLRGFIQPSAIDF